VSREHFLPAALKRGEKDFRWRGGDVSRLEALTDGVFALALTFLVVSLEVPATFRELLHDFARVPVFAVCFCFLVMFWYFHFQFHRRYGLEDAVTVALNAVLLFAILVYVYPLKFLFARLAELAFDLPGEGTGVPPIVPGDWPTLMIVYSAGAAFIFFLYAALHLRAYQLRDDLELDELERFITRRTTWSHLFSMGVSLASLTLVVIRAELYPIAGMVYWLMWPVHMVHGMWTERRARALRTALGIAVALLVAGSLVTVAGDAAAATDESAPGCGSGEPVGLTLGIGTDRIDGGPSPDLAASPLLAASRVGWPIRDRDIPRDDRIEGWSWHLPTDARNFGRNFVHDGWHLYTSPLRMDRTNLLWLLGAAAGFGTLYSVDQELYDAVHRNLDEPPYEYWSDMGEFFEPLGYQGDSNQFYLGGIALGYLLRSSEMIDVSTDILRSHVIIAGPKELMNVTTGRRGPLREEGPRSFEFNDGRSLPSGHSLAIAVTGEVFAHYIRWWPARIAIYTIEASVLFQRVSSDHHWFSDVFVGALGGHLVAGELLERREERRALQREAAEQGVAPEDLDRAEGLDLRFGVGPGPRGGIGVTLLGTF